jgi:hypothetical protein
MKLNMKTLSLAALFAVTAAGAAQAGNQTVYVKDGTIGGETITLGAVKGKVGDLTQSYIAKTVRTNSKTGETCTSTKGYALTDASGAYVGHITSYAPSQCVKAGK